MTLDDIVDTPNRKLSDLKKLQSSRLPLIMYGAGSYAVDVAKFLAKHGVELEAYCVDKKYLDNSTSVKGKRLMAIEKIKMDYPKFNLVIGFSDYVKARQSLKRLGITTGVFFIDAPHQMDFFDYEYIKRHQKEFKKSYDMMADQKSKDIFIAFINAKISGDPSGLYKFAQFDQYFNDLVKLKGDEVFVDCGAYDGDTIKAFLKAVNNKYCKIFAFEPDEDNQEKLSQYVADNNLKNVKILKKGTWSTAATLRFSVDGNMTSASDNGEIAIPVDAIDNTVKGEKVSFIKMDIEGAELPSLRGAKKTIKQYKPKLAICVYHRPDDLITIPQYIKSLYDGYRLYLRHHQHMSWEMVLYGIPQ